uniref:Uncharacterized protein n=1 Tax=Magallana gigas TaxID=29159 RepID=K1Q0B9_MAGGI
MALSKPDVPNTVPDLPVVAQHYLVCGNEDCKKNFQFYCNPCHRPMCNTAGINIRRVRKPRTMKWFLTDSEKYDYQWRSAKIIQIKI